MANSGTPNSNGSRFFIILGEASANRDLPPDSTLLGQVKKNHKGSESTFEKIGAVAVARAPTARPQCHKNRSRSCPYRQPSGHCIFRI